MTRSTLTAICLVLTSGILGHVRLWAEPLDHTAASISVVALGDSITKGVRPGVTTEQTFASIVQRDLTGQGYAVEIHNLGIGGERTDQALMRLDAVVSRQPRFVTVMYGTNDSYVDQGKDRSRISREEYRQNLSRIVQSLRKRGITPILMTEPRWSRQAAKNGVGDNPNIALEPYVSECREVAREHGLQLIDHFAHWTAAEESGQDLHQWTTDGCHPNPRGHQELAKTITPVLLGMLRESIGSRDRPPVYRIASFSVDVTIPLDHRCMGVLPTKSKRIVDPLFAHGFVLTGAAQPFVLCAVDWCEIRNGAYDQWRDTLAAAAGTSREFVLVSSLHQHDAPVVDLDAARILAQAGLSGELYDEAFHDDVLRRVAQAIRDSLPTAQHVTHLGIGQATVDQVASNRRVVEADGRVTFRRGSNSGGDPDLAAQPEGLVDRHLKTLSFWSGDTPVVALHAYATHPMSYYGRGDVTSDFVGLARERRQRDDFSVKQIYVSGCSGDVTAGKYNDGSPEMRLALTERIYEAMVTAWDNTNRVPLNKVTLRCPTFDLPFHSDPSLTPSALQAAVSNEQLTTEQRILAAMGLASRQRVAAGQSIDLPCVDLGAARIVLFPGEAFVGYQLMAQQMCPDSFVMSIGYGECWPGYVPTESAFEDNFQNKWLWVDRGAEARVRAALEQGLGVGGH